VGAVFTPQYQCCPLRYEFNRLRLE